MATVVDPCILLTLSGRLGFRDQPHGWSCRAGLGILVPAETGRMSRYFSDQGRPFTTLATIFLRRISMAVSSFDPGLCRWRSGPQTPRHIPVPDLPLR